MTSVCGIICDECKFYKKECQGCYQQKGTPFWTQYVEEKVCVLYDCCVSKKNYNNCGKCTDLPCNLFKNLRDPETSEEEHLKGIETRVQRLK
ncbi:MAG: DUF3795 domain-containing protein [Bacteroidia bacterium]|nr:DUF3795 domain-containing protein [Bacteroidia bacterium]